MRAALLTAAVGAFFCAGCASDESVICERLEECKLLPDGLSADECEEQAVRQVSGERLSKCAECVEDEDCERIPDACRSDCQPSD